MSLRFIEWVLSADAKREHPGRNVPTQLSALSGHAGMVTSAYTYGRDEEIFGEGEPAEYVYEVISGAVRSYKLLSDGRRQIGASG